MSPNGALVFNVYYIAFPRVQSITISQSVSVCLSVCLVAYLIKLMSKLHEILCTCFLLPWLGPPC